MAFSDRTTTRFDPTFGLFGSVTRSLGLPELGFSEGKPFGYDVISSVPNSVWGETGSTGDNFNTTSALVNTAKNFVGPEYTGPVDKYGSPITGDNKTITTNNGGGNINNNTTNTGGGFDASKALEALGYANKDEFKRATGYSSVEDFLREGGPQAMIQKQIDEAYGSNSSFLDTLEANLRAGTQNFLNTFTKPYESQIPLVQQAGAEGQSKLTAAQDAARQQEQGLLNSARQLFNELSQRNRQQFGSGDLSSLGQATSELLGRSTQQQFGDIRQNAANTINSLVTESRNLASQVEAQINSLNLQKEQALSQAQLALRDKLDEIDAMRNANNQNKAQARLSALQAFRDQQYAIQQQATAFEQSLMAQKQQADLNLRNALANVGAQVSGSLGGAYDALQSFGNQGIAGLQGLGGQNALTASGSAGGFGNLAALLGTGLSSGNSEDKYSLFA